MTHTFTVPNGLAVVGGKAKLWHLSGGVPSGFFTDPAWRLTEPAYPPGMAALVLGCYAMAGGCGEWLTQLVGCAAMALLLGAVLDGLGPGGGGKERIGGFDRFTRFASALWIAALFLDPVPLKMGSLLYPEPFMALCVVTGWRRVWRDIRREDRMGWFLMGAAGWFKNEGAVFAIAAWLVRLGAVAFAARAEKRSAFRAAARVAPALAIALALPLAWHAGVRLAGGELDDYAPLWRPDAARGLKALGEALRLAFLSPWRYAFVYPLLFWPVSWDSARVRDALFAALCMAAFAWILACSRAPDFEWHFSTSLPRLLWTPALVAACTRIDEWRNRLTRIRAAPIMKRPGTTRSDGGRHPPDAAAVAAPPTSRPDPATP